MFDKVSVFYDKWSKIPSFKDDESENFKLNFFKDNLESMKLYKFIPFDGSSTLDKIKLNTLFNNELWLCAPYIFEDETECALNVNVYEVVKLYKKQGLDQINELKKQIACFREMNDICCFTNSIRADMWKHYANNYNGICCEFEMFNSNYFFPVLYCDKENFDLTEIYQKSIKEARNPNIALENLNFIANVSPVLKDKQLYKYEKEIRLVSCDEYDDKNGKVGGTIYPCNKKRENYPGVSMSYKKAGLKLNKIFLGKNLDFSIANSIISNSKTKCELYKEENI